MFLDWYNRGVNSCVQSFGLILYNMSLRTFLFQRSADSCCFFVLKLNWEGKADGVNARIAIIFPIGEFTVDFNMFSGLSIAFMVSADVILMPGEALIKIISVKHQKEYGNVKTAVDASLVVLAVIVSLIFLNTIYGVSEGTLIAAFTIGNFSRFFRGYTNKMVREAALQ